uniref:RNA-directed RNA polymerase n=1 Tax=Stapleton virus TaxID=2600331 RepID=A0A5B8XD17_9VIRU|nr:hypothetical protein 2 [Stapleton virus]
MEEAYSSTKTQIPLDFLSYSGYLRAVRKLENSSSPGYPYNREATTIGKWLGMDEFGNVNTVQLHRLWFDVQTLINNENPVLYHSVFLKEEPHSTRKVELGRWRIIIAFPLHLQVLWHMVFDCVLEKEIEQCYMIPSQYGLKLNGGGWRDYLRAWKSKNFNAGLDKSAWDHTVVWDKLEDELELTTRLVDGEMKSAWVSIARNLYNWSFNHCLLLLSDGTVVEQTVPGYMKSGCVRTISINSKLQILDHVIVCLEIDEDPFPLPVSVGDDTLQCERHAFVEEYINRGTIVKEVSLGIEFVGLEFTTQGPQPLYLEKHLFTCAYVEPTPNNEMITAWLDAMMRYYAYSPYRVIWRFIAQEIGVLDRLRSDEYYLAWYEYDLI